MEKRLCVLWALLTLALSLNACAQQPGSVSDDTSLLWQEQNDLGVRYLSEGNFEEAIIAFTAAIEIDSKQVPAYIGRGDAYFALGDYSRAEADYSYALELDPSLDLYDMLGALDEARKAETTEILPEELYPYIADLDLPFTVDDLTLGVTDIAVAIATYSDLPYALSNLMNDDSVDAVYTCFGMNGMPIPEGHMQDEFGFFFAGPPEGGAIHTMIVQDPGSDFTCLGGLRVGDSETSVFEFFGFPEQLSTKGIYNMQWTLENGAELSYNGYFTYQLGSYMARVYLGDGVINGIQLTVESE